MADFPESVITTRIEGLAGPATEDLVPRPKPGEHRAYFKTGA
jgi:hypothetical protein